MKMKKKETSLKWWTWERMKMKKKNVESKIIKMFDREWKWIKKKYQIDESKMMKIYEREEKWQKKK